MPRRRLPSHCAWGDARGKDLARAGFPAEDAGGAPSSPTSEPMTCLPRLWGSLQGRVHALLVADSMQICMLCRWTRGHWRIEGSVGFCPSAAPLWRTSPRSSPPGCGCCGGAVTWLMLWDEAVSLGTGGEGFTGSRRFCSSLKPFLQTPFGLRLSHRALQCRGLV